MIQNQKLPSGKSAPMFAHVYRLTTAEESNNQGEWAGWVISHERALDLSNEEDQYVAKAAIAFHKQVSAGEVKGQMEGEDAGPEEAGDEGANF
jgi:hypothetical protein